MPNPTNAPFNTFPNELAAFPATSVSFPVFLTSSVTLAWASAWSFILSSSSFWFIKNPSWANLE